MHHLEGHRSPRGTQGLHTKPLPLGLQDAPVNVQVSSGSDVMSQGRWGTPNTSCATPCMGWRVLIHPVPNPIQPCKTFRKGPGKLHCQSHKSRPNKDPWITGIVEWPRSKVGKAPGVGNAPPVVSVCSCSSV